MKIQYIENIGNLRLVDERICRLILFYKKKEDSEKEIIDDITKYWLSNKVWKNAVVNISPTRHPKFQFVLIVSFEFRFNKKSDH